MVELKTFVLPVKWITKLAKAYAGLYKKRRDAIETITNVFGDPEALARYYVEPDCQNINPANFRDSGPDMVARVPVFTKLAQFFPVYERDSPFHEDCTKITGLEMTGNDGSQCLHCLESMLT